MNARLTILAVVILAFGVLTVAALMDVGYIGIFQMHLKTWGGMQVLTDLAIMGLLVCIWMVLDARHRGLNPWPFVLITLAAGSFGPLFYLFAREVRAAPVTTRAE